MMLCSCVSNGIQSWLRDYDRLQSVAVVLLYVQIGLALVGSLGAMYNGVAVVNLAIALFALVAIESGSQRLGRTYAFLLLSAIFLDFIWFTLFSYDIWHISSSSSKEEYGALFLFSLKLVFVMQILGLSVRISSSLLWIQMYRLGASSSHTETAVDFDLRNSFISPATPAATQTDSEDPLGGSIYDPAYYYSLFEVTQLHQGGNRGDKDGDSSSEAESCKLKLSLGNAFQAITDDNAANRLPDSG